MMNNIKELREELSKKYVLKTDVIKLLRGIAGQMYLNNEKKYQADDILIERAVELVSNY